MKSEPGPDHIGGIIVATTTPFGSDGSVCRDTIAAHIDYLAQGGIPAVAPAGTTGEFLYLTEAEREEVVCETVAAARGRLKVIAGIWALDADGVGRLARAAEASGADAVFLTTPIYYPASEQAVLQWYRAARSHTGLPLFAYSIPQYAANSVATDTLRRLLDEGTVQGIKDSTGSEARVKELLDITGGDGTVYGASDSFALRARELGCDGFISALANIFPAAFVRIWEGDREAQASIDRVRALVKGYGGIGGLKALFRAKGLDFGVTRLPFGDVSSEDERQLIELVNTLRI